MPTRSIARRIALVAGVASLAAASPAAADSILFVRDHDIYLTTPDGSRTFQVTSTKDIGTASQADDGTIIATAGTEEHLRKLDRFGNVLADFATPVSDGPTPTATGSTNYFEGPYDPQISPDGTKVAYTYYWQHYTANPGGCGGDPGCMGQRLESGTAISHSDRLTPWADFGNLTGWKSPTWWGNDRILRSNAGVAMSENVVVNTIGPGLGDSQLTRWMSESHYDERDDATITRDGQKLAVADQDWDGVPGSFRTVQGIRFYDASKGLGAKPEPCYRAGFDKDGEYTSRPSWSPDGNHLVFEMSGTLQMIDVPSMTGCTGTTPAGATEARKFLDNAASPSWGPADVPTGRSAAQAGGQPGGTPATGGGKAGALGAKARKAKLAKALKRGVTVSYTAPAKGTLSLVARKSKRVVARGKGKAKAAGAASATLKFTKAGRKALKRSAKATLRVSLAFKPVSGTPATQSLKLTLKR